MRFFCLLLAACSLLALAAACGSPSQTSASSPSGSPAGTTSTATSDEVSAVIFDGQNRFPLTIVRASGNITEIKGKTLMWCPLTMLAPPLTFDDTANLSVASDGSFSGDISAPEDPGSSYWHFEGSFSGSSGSGHLQLFSPSAPNSSGCGSLNHFWSTDPNASQP